MLGEVFINCGDEILYCSPTYEAFPDMVSDNGGKRVEVPLTPDCKYDLDGMLAAVGDPDLIDEMMKACQAWNVSRIASLAATTALDEQEYVQKVKAENVKNRKIVYEGLLALGCYAVKPAASFIYFDTHRDPKAIAQGMTEHGILISAPNACFNRVTVGTPEQNRAFLKALPLRDGEAPGKAM